MGFARVEMEKFRDLLIAVLNDEGMRSQILYELKCPRVRDAILDFMDSIEFRAKGRR